MENVVDITQILAQEIADNAAIPVHEGDTYFLHDPAKHTYAFLIIPHDRLQKSIIAMLARMNEDNKVIIEVDHTDTPLYQSLIDLGVPRQPDYPRLCRQDCTRTINFDP